MPGRKRWLPDDLKIGLVLALLLGAIWTAALLMAARIERHGMEYAFAEARSMAQLLKLHGTELVLRVETLHRLGRLVTLAHLAGAPGDPASLAELRKSVELAGSNVLQVSGLDAAGDVIWSTLPMPPGRVNLAQREHYQAIARDGLDHIVGRPVRGAVSGRWTIQFAEALRDSDRRLLGITVVSVDAGLAEALARELNMADRGVISLDRNDGVLLARSIGAHIGEVVPKEGSVWWPAWQAGGAEALEPGPRDGVPRFYAARRIPGSDLVIVVGLDAAVQMAPVHASSAVVLRGAAALGFTLTLLAAALSWGLRRQRGLSRERLRVHDLAEREALLRHIAENATDIISLQDAEQRNLYVSPALRSVLGIDPRPLIGRRFGAPADPSEAPAVAAALDRLDRTGGATRFAFRARHADGSFRWLETEMVAIPDIGDETGCRYISISRDITSRKQAEAALRQTQQQLENLYRLGPGTLYQVSIGPDGERRLRIPFAGPLEKMGYAAEDLNSDFFLRRVHPLDLTRTLEAKQRCLKTGEALVEYRFPNAAGEIRWIRDEMRVAGQDGDCTIVIGYLTDVTAEHAAREDLASLLQLGPGMLYRIAIGPNGERCPTVPASNFITKLGYTVEQVCVPGFVMGRIHPLDAPLLAEAIGQCARTGQAVVEYRFPTAAGEMRWLRDDLLLAGQEGGWVDIVTYVTDITAERETKIRAQQNERLATLGELATGIAHELNQPLAAIGMAAENGSRALARDPPNIDTAAAKFVRISEQTRRLGKVINHIRMFGRKETAQPVAFPVDEVVRNALLLVNARLQSAATTVTVDLPPDLPQPFGTPILLEQVVINLIVNACDAYAESGPGDSAAAKRRIRIVGSREGDTVLLSVADHAGGIPPDVIARVFDPFFTTKPAGQGTGLGLSISLATITGMGGQLSVRNDAGGAVFEIRLPVAAGASAPAPAPADVP